MMKDGKKCGKNFTIWPRGKKGETHEATVVDTCADCGKHDINVSKDLLNLFIPDKEGRRKVTWQPSCDKYNHCQFQ